MADEPTTSSDSRIQAIIAELPKVLRPDTYNTGCKDLTLMDLERAYQNAGWGDTSLLTCIALHSEDYARILRPLDIGFSFSGVFHGTVRIVVDNHVKKGRAELFYAR